MTIQIEGGGAATSGTAPLLITGAAPANVNQGALEVGGGVFGGGGGTFSGTGAGTALAINLPAASGADFISCQVAGVTYLQIIGAYTLFGTSGSAYRLLNTGTVAANNSPSIGFNGNGYNGSASGCMLGGSAQSGFAGNLIDLQVNGTSRFSVGNAGGVIMPSLGAFAALDKYVTIDATGNLHKSALGPAS